MRIYQHIDKLCPKLSKIVDFHSLDLRRFLKVNQDRTLITRCMHRRSNIEPTPKSDPFENYVPSYQKL